MRHQIIVHSIIHLQDKLGFLGVKFDELFCQRFPKHPHFPSFDIWRIMQKQWVSSYESICHEDICVNLEKYLGTRYDNINKSNARSLL